METRPLRARTLSALVTLRVTSAREGGAPLVFSENKENKMNNLKGLVHWISKLYLKLYPVN